MVKSKKPLKLFTFFSGGFGTPELSLKYLNIPFENCVACEYDKFARESYIKNHGEPKLEMSHDIFKFDGKKYLGVCDLAHFSPECVDYSLAGKRKGEEGRSGGQYDKTIKIIGDMKPKIVIIENVANFALQFKDVMDRVIGELEELGYQTSYHIMSADDYGTPQTRKRVFLVGFLGTGSNFSTPLKVKTNICIGDLMEENVDDKYYLSQRALNGFKAKVERQDMLKALGEKRDKGLPSFTFRPKSREAKTIGTITSRYAKQGITDPYLIDPKGKTIIYRVGHGAFKGGVLITDKCPSITTSSWEHNNFFSNAKKEIDVFSIEAGIRRLTPREASRAMGDFQDKFNIDGFSDSRLYKFIGNAIDISTYKALLIDVFKHSECIDFDKPFVKKSVAVQLDLFGSVA